MSLIVIDGLDGSGKATQTGQIYRWIEDAGKKVRKVSFPDYDSESSALVKMYLRGDFGREAGDVNPYAASSFFAVDRYASFQRNWKADYERGTTILCDRYSTSNAIHQMTKLSPKQWKDYLLWQEDFEYEKLGIPRPSLVLYLDMDPEVANKLISGRYGGDEGKRDIHENLDYLKKCRDAAMFAAEVLQWKVVVCSDSQNPYTIPEITEKLKREIGKVVDIHD